MRGNLIHVHFFLLSESCPRPFHFLCFDINAQKEDNKWFLRRKKRVKENCENVKKRLRQTLDLVGGQSGDGDEMMGRKMNDLLRSCALSLENEVGREQGSINNGYTLDYVIWSWVNKYKKIK